MTGRLFLPRSSIFNLVAFLGAALCLYSMRQADPDFWGYLSAGQLYAANGGLVQHDPFAFTAPGHDWIAFEWGAELALWSAYRYAGAWGLLGLKFLLGGIALYSLHSAIRLFSEDESTWVFCFLLSASGLSRFFLFRPQLFTFAGFAIYTAVLFRYVQRGRAPLYAMPLVMLVWANTHGGFVAGLGAIGLAIWIKASMHVAEHGWHPRDTFRSVRELVGVFAGCTLVTFVNPHGARLWGYILTELTHSTNRHYISEWAPPSLTNDPWSAGVLLLLTAALGLASAVALTSTPPTVRRKDLVWTLSAVPLLAISFISVRQVPLAAIWTAPVIARLASGLKSELMAPTARRAWFVVRGLGIVPVCLTCLVVFFQPQPAIMTGPPTLGATDPCRVVAYMRQAGLAGRMYTPLWWGSYVTWNLYPAIQVSMDGRNISRYPDSLVIENLRFYTARSGDVDLDAPLRHSSDFLLLPSNAPASALIQQDDRWQPLIVDRDATVFVRSDRSPDIAARPLAVVESTTCEPDLR